MYSIKGWDNDPILGKFYDKELQKVSADSEIEYIIDDVIREEMQGKRKGFIVKWKGWPDRYNSWVPEEDVKDREYRGR